MHGLLVAVKIDQAGVDEAMKMLNDQVVPTVKSAPGFVAGYWMRDESAGMGYSIAIFDTEQAANDARDNAPTPPEGAPVSIANIQVLPVVASA
ncbi:MAG TPA: hypothetical protein VFV02_03015 [Acidimicrobiales bacterium]|nr:hypothetical protein [Acidimicrobiales bacterium]